VVPTAMIEVTTCGVARAGQFVTSGAQLVTVNTDVLKIVEVVIGTPALSVMGLSGAVEDPNDDDGLPACELCPTALVEMAGAELACDSAMEVALTCFTVAEAVPQSKPML